MVVVVNADFLADILLGDAKALLYAQLYRQAVGVPTGLAVDVKALLSLVAAEDILDGTCHNVVNARLAVSRRRSVVEHKCGVTLTQFLTFLKSLVFFPPAAHFFANLGQIKLLIFVIFHILLYIISHIINPLHTFPSTQRNYKNTKKC